MRKIITSIGIAALILSSAAACDSTKKASEEKENMTTENVDKTPKDNISSDTMDMIEGTIVYSEEEGDCMWTIKTADTMYDPTNLEDVYKKNGTKVLFKFAGLRMMNRCTKASPIRIEGIQEKK